MTRTGLVAEKVALITGAGSGIGRATAALFALEGAAAVGVLDRDPDAAEETARLVREYGAEALPLCADVAKRSEVDERIRELIEQFGGLDCAVNNAGIAGAHRRLADHTDADWSQILAVNLDGVFFCMRREIQAMLERGAGAIVNVSSGVVATAEPGLAPYGATKHAVMGLTEAAAGEYAADGIRINAVLPGGIRTPAMERYVGAGMDARAKLAPMRRLGAAGELAEAIVWLCSDRASYVHGVGLRVDGAKHTFTPNAISDPERFGLLPR